MLLKITTLLAFATVLANACDVSDLNMPKMMLMAQECDSGLVNKLASEMVGPDVNARMGYLCQPETQRRVVNFAVCLMDKFKDCMPAEAKPFMHFLPSRERMTEGMEFYCSNKAILTSPCMQEQAVAIQQCYMGKIGQLVAAGPQAILSDMKGMICKVVRAEEDCIEMHQGSCSDKYVKTIDQLIEKFFPMSECPKEVKMETPNKMDSLLNSILVHGMPQGGNKRPLVFKSALEDKMRRYNIKM